MSNILSIGILAYNEAASIEKMLQGLLLQSVFQKRELLQAIEVIVVPNGCTDNTAELAKAIFSSTHLKSEQAITLKVIELEQGSKANAWNAFVHQFSSKEASYLALMDADIEFLNTTVLEEMLVSVLNDDEKWLNVGNPLKAIALKPNKTPIEQLSILASQMSRKKVPQLCGQLYLGKAFAIRGITLPAGMVAQDGFLGQLFSTDYLTVPYNAARRMIRLNQPSHTFEAYTTPKSFWKHEVQLTKSTLMHQFLYDFLKAKSQTHGLCVQKTIEYLNHNDPAWVNAEFSAMLSQKTSTGKYWLLPGWMFSKRLRALRQAGFLKALLTSPLAIVFTIIDWAVCFEANKQLKSQQLQKYWR